MSTMAAGKAATVKPNLMCDMFTAPHCVHSNATVRYAEGVGYFSDMVCNIVWSVELMDQPIGALCAP